ncbi:MAG: galactokinase [Candidatus Paceibacterota bacterium]|jgi:D-glycero-alpha-D-manno-heptose-7-phosphate kinase
MIITRTPFRFTLGGGGTDLPAYYSKYGGFIFSAGINKYMFININQPVADDLIRIKYDDSETVKSLDLVRHDIAREALRMMHIKNNIDIASMADIPGGTGLGSSSCYAVGLLNGLHAIKKQKISRRQLAEKACKLEIDILKKPIGKQDQYIATFGGLTVLDIDKKGKVKVRSAKLSDETIENLNRNLLMFYTNTSRDANVILAEQSHGAKQEQKNVIESMHYIKEIGYKILKAAESGNITDIGVLFDKHWQHKKKISSKMSNPRFDKIYNIAKENGALGGKILGAGGGGFFIFYIEKKQSEFRKVIKELGLREMEYAFDFEGTKVLANFENIKK